MESPFDKTNNLIFSQEKGQHAVKFGSKPVYVGLRNILKMSLNACANTSTSRKGKKEGPFSYVNERLACCPFK